jgi:hypothetical protein
VTEERNDLVGIDRESLQMLRSLMHSVEVCLTGLDDRIKRELEVIEVSMALSQKAKTLLNQVLSAQEKQPPHVVS